MAMVTGSDTPGTPGTPGGVQSEPEIPLTEEEMAERQRQLEELLAEEESSDEDSVPEPPLFDLELKWFRVYADKPDERVPYTKTKCVVKVRITDTVGELRKKVQDFTQLSKFKLIVSETGEELLQSAPHDSDDEDEDEDGEKTKKEDDEEEEEEEDDEEAEVNDEYDAIDVSELLGTKQESKDGDGKENENVLLYDDRTLSMIGIKEPKENEDENNPEGKNTENGLERESEKKTEEDSNSDNKDESVGGDSKTRGGVMKKKRSTIDASFLPRDLPPVAEGKENDNDNDNSNNTTGGGGGGGGGRDSKRNRDTSKRAQDDKGGDDLLDSNLDDLTFDDENLESVTIEIEEFDDMLDSRMFVKQESSEVLYQRALNAANKKWWDRAADGNLDMVKEIWAGEVRKELMQINWHNPDNHQRTALMIASFRGQYRTVKWLVKEKGARVNGSDDLGCTALNLAARGGAPKVVKFLLENRAKASTPDSNGWTAAVWALTMGHLEVLQIMADKGVSLEDLGRAAPFASQHMSPTTLMPLPCVRYKADQTFARLELEKKELAKRAKAHALKQEQMRAEKEAELLGMQEELKRNKLREYRHRFMRDARENWHMHEERLKPFVKAERKKNKLLARQAAETSMFS